MIRGRQRRRVGGLVAAARLGVGESVTVMTRAGIAVKAGRVASVSPQGALVVVEDREGRTVEAAFYRDDVYWFVPTGAPRRVGPVRPIRVRLHETQAEGTTEAPDETEVDLDTLPDDIRGNVAPGGILGVDARERVLSAVGDAALEAARRAGVPSEQLYGMVDRVQQAVAKVLDVYAETDEDVVQPKKPKADADADAEDGDDEADEDEDDAADTQALAAAEAALAAL